MAGKPASDSGRFEDCALGTSGPEVSGLVQKMGADPTSGSRFPSAEEREWVEPIGEPSTTLALTCGFGSAGNS